jgi:hypothetical protein
VNNDQDITNVTIPLYKKDLYKISEQDLQDYIKTAVTALENAIKSYHDTVNSLPRIRPARSFQNVFKDGNGEY